MPLPVSGTRVPVAGAAGAAAGEAAFASGVEVFEFVSVATFAFEFDSVVVPSGLLDRTETLPVSAGIDSISAETMNVIAAVIVIFDKIVAVPRGASAELETLLVNKAPASVLPGCNRTAAIKMMHDKKKIV